MARLEILSFSLILAVAVNCVACSSNEIQSDIEVLVVPNIAEFSTQRPALKLQPLVKDTKLNSVSPYTTRTYKFGKRIAGDRLLTTDSANQKWNRAQNVKKTLNYPAKGVGAVVTYVEIVVVQSTNLGRAYVVSGGIGQRRISVVIEAQSTLNFSCKASIFGY